MSASGQWLALTCCDGSVDMYAVMLGQQGEQALRVRRQRTIDAAAEAGILELAPRTCFLASCEGTFSPNG